MITIEIIAFAIVFLLAIIALFRIINDSRKNICSIIINTILGGTIFVVLNMMGFSIKFNIITGGIIVFLGIPGTILIVILKLLFGIF